MPRVEIFSTNEKYWSEVDAVLRFYRMMRSNIYGVQVRASREIIFHWNKLKWRGEKMARDNLQFQKKKKMELHMHVQQK